MKNRVLSPSSKLAKGKRRRISNLFRNFLALKFSQGRRLPRRRLLQSKSTRPRSKSVQPTSSSQSADNEGDRISKLPDDILMIILSFMTTKEATATCVLSKRWRYLCASLPRLDCSCDAYLRDKLYDYSFEQREETLEKERFMFINWVNSLVKMHQGQTLEEFRIDFPLDQNFSHVVDPWIQFALSKRLQRLVLGLSPTTGIGSNHLNYSFPISDVSLVGLTSLTTLYLHCVNVKQEVVEHIISYCPMLEELSLFDSVYMGYFKLAGPALQLKHLCLIRCPGLKRIEICDTNIVSFKFAGWKDDTKLHLENLPHLIELYVDIMESPISYAFDPISGLFSHLESLTLNFSGFLTDGAYGRIARPRDVNFFDIVAYPKLSKLRHLVVNMEMIGDFGLLKLVPLINACPYLQKFVLQFSWIEIEKHVRIAKNVIKTIECPHQHLKVVEFAGYYGRVSDVEFAMYFIQNAVALERMIIIPKSAFVWLPVTNTTIVQKKIVQKKKIKREAKARRRAKEQLEGNVPPTIDLVIH